MNPSIEGIQEKPASKMALFRKAQKKANRELYKLTLKRPVLNDAIPAVRSILGVYLGEDLAKALTEGIYCGIAGQSCENIEGYPSKFVMDWYNGRLEVAYIS